MREFTHLFANVYSSMANLRLRDQLRTYGECDWQPPVDIFEKEDAIVVVVELPGVTKNDIDARVEQGVLLITGEREKDVPTGTRHVHQLEIPSGRFVRALPLPDDVDADQIEAAYESGYLVFTLPKKRTT